MYEPTCAEDYAEGQSSVDWQDDEELIQQQPPPAADIIKFYSSLQKNEENYEQ